MPSTHLSLHYHLVFSTKDRVPIISSERRESLHAYTGGIIKNMDGIPEAIGGTSDHIHLLIGLRATHCLAHVMRDLKSVSSRWMHEQVGEQPPIWQDGYGAFTVGASQVQSVSDSRRASQKEDVSGRIPRIPPARWGGI
jgi:REP element-mobilizing transposase RayT